MIRITLKAAVFFLIFLISFKILERDTIPHRFSRISPPMNQVSSIWADSVLKSLSLEEKIAQLLFIPAYSNQNNAYNNKLEQLIDEAQPGGVVFMKGSPVNQALLTNKLQAKSTIPLMIAMDAEWGPAVRLDSVTDFPVPLTLGAMDNEQLVYELGFEVARQLKLLGVHVNFAPVLDINMSEQNEVISYRSYGQDKQNVARKGFAFAMGLQSNHILAVGKHFPGHGSTIVDSHKKLPINKNPVEQLENFEFYPFINLIQNGLGGLMIGHVSVPAVEMDRVVPASLSELVIDTLVKNRLGFQGIIFSDAMNMSSVVNFNGEHTKEVSALKAGNDVIIFPDKPKKVINDVLAAIEQGILDTNEINAKCRKVLQTKYWLGLDDFKSLSIQKIKKELKSQESDFLSNRIVEKSLTLVQNKSQLVPVRKLNEKKILCLSFDLSSHEFNSYLNNYTQVDTISMNGPLSIEEQIIIEDTTLFYSQVIIAIGGQNQSYQDNYGINEERISLIAKLANRNTILVVFASPYSLSRNIQADNPGALLLAYENTKRAHKWAAQAVFGGIALTGNLPVSVDENYIAGSGERQEKPIRLKYTSPLDEHVADTALCEVDSIILKAIEDKAIPGCQILFAQHGKVLYNKCFGHFTYEQKQPVKPTTIYDLASVTKVAASTVSLIKLYEKSKIDLSTKLSKYLPELKHSDKRGVRINEILSHQSGLHSWIPYYRNTLNKEGELRKELYREDSSELYAIRVAENLYIRSDYRDSIYQSIIDTPLYRQKKYRYSDLGFYWMSELIKSVSGAPIDIYAQHNYYRPLGMNNTAFNPYLHFQIERIPPTEEDNIFRKKTIRGYVHDPGAAMLGGVSGHAGLFSNTNDLAKLGQLLLNEGRYGGEIYFKDKSLQVFNKQYYARKDNRRALGFDKPVLRKGDIGPTCESASPKSFGHSGFTGTYFWIDPEYESIYIFLSNRTYPDQENNKLIKQNIRTDIQQIFYDVFQH